MGFEHKSVLLNETIEGLNIKPDGIYVDGTLGGGGHAYEVCRRLGEKGSIIGIDQDEAAIEAAGIRLKDFGEKVTIIRSNYCEMKSKLQEQGIDKVDGIVLDLGVSSIFFRSYAESQRNASFFGLVRTSVSQIQTRMLHFRLQVSHKQVP